MLIASLILNLAFVLFFIGKRIYFANSHKWGLIELRELQHLPIDELSIVFVGDSLTEGFPIEEMFPSKPVRNRGIRGNTSKDILDRIGSIAAAKPQKIFLNVGINDIFKKIPLDTLFINYNSVVKTIQSCSPGTKIYIQSLLPVGKELQSVQPSIIAFNKTLKDFCENNSITFIDLFSPFCGLLENYYTTDGLHVNRSAYEVWRNVIARYV